MKKSKTGDKGVKKSGHDVQIDKATCKVTDKASLKLLVGIDEVGRGPLAGPVTVGACAVLIEGSTSTTATYKNLRKKLMEISGEEYPIGVDSKKMKESEREFWYNAISKLVRRGDIFISVKSLSAKMIDTKGIAVCIKELVDANIKTILKNSKVELESVGVLLDGGLTTNLTVASQKTIIKGDEKELLISLASVYAKVTRDRHMKKLSRNTKYIVYGFDIHKGYGTAGHRLAIRQKGLSDEHRRSFCKNFTGK